MAEYKGQGIHMHSLQFGTKFVEWLREIVEFGMQGLRVQMEIAA